MKKELLPIFLVVLVDILGFTIILPLLPLYAEHLGATPLLAGLLVSVFGLCQLLAGPVLGSISDRIGRKPVLIGSQVGTLIGFLILATTNNLWLIFLSRIIDGLTAGNISVAQAYISDVTQPHERAKSFGLIGISFGIGFLIGPMLSGLLAPLGLHFPIYVACALSFASILLTQFLLPAGKPPAVSATTERKNSWAHYARWFRTPGLASLLWQFMAFIVPFAMFVSTFPLFAERRFTVGGSPVGAREIGWIYAYWGLTGIVIQGGLIGPLVRRFGEKRLAAAGFLATSATFVLLSFAESWVPLFILITLCGIGGSLLRPALASLITQRVERSEQGMAAGLMQAIMSVAQIVAPAFGGWMMGHHLLVPWALAGAVIAASGLLLFGRI